MAKKSVDVVESGAEGGTEYELRSYGTELVNGVTPAPDQSDAPAAEPAKRGRGRPKGSKTGGSKTRVRAASVSSNGDKQEIDATLQTIAQIQSVLEPTAFVLGNTLTPEGFASYSGEDAKVLANASATAIISLPEDKADKFLAALPWLTLISVAAMQFGPRYTHWRSVRNGKSTHTDNGHAGIGENDTRALPSSSQRAGDSL